MLQRHEEEVFTRLLAARALALALNPTLERDEIAHRLLELAGNSRAPLARALARLVIRSLERPSRAAERATDALRLAIELQASTDTARTDPVAAQTTALQPHSDWPLGPAA